MFLNIFNDHPLPSGRRGSAGTLPFPNSNPMDRLVIKTRKTWRCTQQQVLTLRIHQENAADHRRIGRFDIQNEAIKDLLE